MSAVLPRSLRSYGVTLGIAALCVTSALNAQGNKAQSPAASKPLTSADVIAASQPSDWRLLDPQHTLYMEMPGGRVVIELAPDFAPRTTANVEALVRAGFFDGLAFVRSQDNYVVQWGDAEADRPKGAAEDKIRAEFTRPAKDLAFTALPDPDTYAPQTGFSNSFPAARDLKTNQAWLTHCYGAVGVGRDTDADSGNGMELYAVIGHAPRHLDRNITLVGRVVQGMELLSVLPRGTGNLGFYEKPEERIPIKSIRLAVDVPESERTQIEVLRTDTPTFQALVEMRRNRRDEWYKVRAGRVEVCNVLIPTRPRASTP